MRSTRALVAAVLCLTLSPALAEHAPPDKDKAHAARAEQKKAHAVNVAEQKNHAAKAEHKSHAAKAERKPDAPSGEPVRVTASVYWEGTRVATGRKFDPNGMTVAHRTLPLGTRLVVSYGRNFCEVIVNDRGPFVRGRDIDLTRGVAKALHFPGLGKVRVAYWPPLPRPRPSEANESRVSEN